MNCLVVVVVTALVSVSVTQGYLSTNRYRWKTQTNRDLTSSIRSTITNNEEYISSSLSKDLQEVCNANNYPLRVQEMFYAMMVNDDFRTKYYQKKPFLITHNLPNLAGAFTMNDVKTSVESDFLEAGRGTFQEGRSGWNMAAVSRPKGKSYEDAKLKYDEVEEALRQQNGTVVFNSAGGFIPKLAEVCLQTLNAFQLPVAINMYLTNPGQKTSAPPHTDKQDVFVLQTQGYKRWRVFNPPPPNRLFKADPFARGKGTDVLELEELEQPLIDTVLSPGQVLYVPAGFPHTTDTITNIPETSDASVHLTIGVDTIIWGLNYAYLRSAVLLRAGIEDKVVISKLSPSTYWKLQSSLPMGLFAEAIMAPHEGNPGAMRTALFQAIAGELISCMRLAEPTMWKDMTDVEMAEDLSIYESIGKLLQHHMEITDTFGRMYHDVANKVTPSKMDLSFFRSQPYFQELEKRMEELESWKKSASTLSKLAGMTGKIPNKKDKKKSTTKSTGFGK